VTQPAPSRSTIDRPVGILPVVRELFRQLDSRGVVYCHWKSNEHLDAGLRGVTDLDVLVDWHAGPALASLLEEVGFKRIAAVPGRAYPGVEDFLALDPSTGRFAHLHLHYRLVLGEKNLKGYSLPWESAVLATRKVEPISGVFVSDPHIELILLVIRAALKLRNRDFLTAPFDPPRLSGGTLDEFLWLVARVDRERLQVLARDLVGAEAADLLVRMTSGLPSHRDLRSFAEAVNPLLRPHRTYGPLEALRRRWGREWEVRWGGFRNRTLGGSIPVKHVLPRGGLVVAFVGSDGSGKSTVVREIAGWLSWKLDVRAFYMGSGDGPASLLRRPLQAFAALWGRARARFPSPPTDEAGAAAIGTLGNARPGARLARSVWRCAWSLALAREKRDRLGEVRRARNLGMVAICDRYPQCQFGGFNDGPQLGSWLEHPSRLLRTAAAWELAAYRCAERAPPDLVVKLHVPAAVAAQRKEDTSLEQLTRKAAAIRALRFPAGVRVVDIDAAQPLDTVLVQVKRAIWEAL